MREPTERAVSILCSPSSSPLTSLSLEPSRQTQVFTREQQGQSHTPLSSLTEQRVQSVSQGCSVFSFHTFFSRVLKAYGENQKRKRQNFLKFSLEITKFSKYHPKRCKKGEQNKDKILIQIEMEFYPKLYKIISSIQVAI